MRSALVLLVVALASSIQCQPLTSEQELIHDLVAEHVLNQANIPVSFRMENPVVPFVGRAIEKEELKWAHLDRKMVILTGPRGVGKSELARKYAQEIKIDTPTSTIWINSESHSSVIDAFKDLALSVGLRIENKDVTSIMKTVFDHFKGRKTLFIFDNAEEDNIFVNNLPVWIGNSKLITVLVTSRKENWDTAKFKIIQIKPFTLDESKEFIKAAITKEISIVVDDESCTKLAQLLHYLPLALSGAVTDIIKHNSLNPGKQYGIDEFIVSFNAKPVQNVTVTEVRGPSPEELEDAVSNKLREEVRRVENSVKNEARRVKKKLKKIFG